MSLQRLPAPQRVPPPRTTGRPQGRSSIDCLDSLGGSNILALSSGRHAFPANRTGPEYVMPHPLTQERLCEHP